jgi:hypothetical protein
MEEYRQFNQSASILNRNQSSGNDIWILGLSSHLRLPHSHFRSNIANQEDRSCGWRPGLSFMDRGWWRLDRRCARRVCIGSPSSNSASGGIKPLHERRDSPFEARQSSTHQPPVSFQPYLPPSAGNRPRTYRHLNRPSHVAADRHSGGVRCPHLMSTPPPTSRISNTLYRGRQTRNTAS